MDGKHVLYVDQGAIETLCAGGEAALTNRHELRVPAMEIDGFLPWYELGEHAEYVVQSAWRPVRESRFWWVRAREEVDRLAEELRCFSGVREIDGRWPRGADGRGLVRFTAWFESDLGRLADGYRLARDVGFATLRIAPASLWAMQPEQPAVRAAFAGTGVVPAGEWCSPIRSRAFELDAIKLGVLGHVRPAGDLAYDVLPLMAWWQQDWWYERPRPR